MKVKMLNVNYFIEGNRTVIPTKMVYEEQNEDEYLSIHYEVELNDQSYVSRASVCTEFAVIALQKALPGNMSIACCQSCRHGNFCPFGDQEDEIFCFKDTQFHNKYDVVEKFSNRDESLTARKRKLLAYCSDYKPISHQQFYTYNDWGINSANAGEFD